MTILINTCLEIYLKKIKENLSIRPNLINITYHHVQILLRFDESFQQHSKTLGWVLHTTLKGKER